MSVYVGHVKNEGSINNCKDKLKCLQIQREDVPGIRSASAQTIKAALIIKKLNLKSWVCKGFVLWVIKS